MAFTKFTYTKSWENPSNFPTIQSNETQVRKDMQLLFDEAKAGVDSLTDQLAATTGAANIGASITDISAATVAGAIAEAMSKVGYTTTAPTAANTVGVKIAILSSEPETKYDGWLYFVGEAE